MFACNIRQKDRIAMGSPLGSTLADIYVAKLENTALSEDTSKVAFRRRYVDGIICISGSAIDSRDTTEFGQPS